MTNTGSKPTALDALHCRIDAFCASSPLPVILTHNNPPPQHTKDDTVSTQVMEATYVPNTTSMPHHMIPPVPVAPPPQAPTLEAATPPSMEALQPSPVLPASQMPVCPLMEAEPILMSGENHSQSPSRMPPASPNHGPSD